MNNDCVDVDELILELADYKNDLADMAAEKLFRKCLTSWEAYRYLGDRVLAAWLFASARQTCAELSNGYKCRYTSLANTGMRVRGS